ncbi:MAG: hypothetical protein ACR2JC_12395 [Chloroflexota bacterium]|nr:MAG: hypothetical protein DLM70_14305 [Chloroflexota bacterium]
MWRAARLEAFTRQRSPGEACRAAAGERLVLSGDTPIIVLANQGVDVRHLLAAIQGALPPT